MKADTLIAIKSVFHLHICAREVWEEVVVGE